MNPALICAIARLSTISGSMVNHFVPHCTFSSANSGLGFIGWSKNSGIIVDSE